MLGLELILINKMVPGDKHLRVMESRIAVGSILKELFLSCPHVHDGKHG